MGLLSLLFFRSMPKSACLEWVVWVAWGFFLQKCGFFFDFFDFKADFQLSFCVVCCVGCVAFV